MSCEYENVTLIGDFNFTVEKKNLDVFMNTFDFECFIEKPTCFQSTSPSCNDLILANKKEILKNSNILEVGVSDHHRLVKGNKVIQLISPTFKIPLLKSPINTLLLRKKNPQI